MDAAFDPHWGEAWNRAAGDPARSAMPNNPGTVIVDRNRQIRLAELPPNLAAGFLLVSAPPQAKRSSCLDCGQACLSAALELEPGKLIGILRNRGCSGARSREASSSKCATNNDAQDISLTPLRA